MNQPNPQHLIAGITQIASLPEIYMKIELAMNNPKSSSKYFSDILSEDIALAAKILRLANSSFFSFPGKISTVTQAITLIGTRQLRDIILASSIVGAFKDIPAELIDMKSFWRHNIACGVTCRIIAMLRRETNVEAAFVSGLLHDIGRLVLYKEKPDAMGELIEKCSKTEELLYRSERNHFGFDHALLGSLLLKEWKLPTRLIKTTACHHTPERAKEYIIETATVHVSDIISNALTSGSSGEKMIPPMSEKAWKILGLEDGNLSLIADELDKQYSVAVDFVLSESP